MTPRVFNLHTWPGREGSTKAQMARTRKVERLVRRPALVLVATAERKVQPERWGLGLALSVMGRSMTGARLVVADDLAARRSRGVLPARRLGRGSSGCLSDRRDSDRRRHPTGVLRSRHRGHYDHLLHRRRMAAHRGRRTLPRTAGRLLGGGPRRKFRGGFVLGLPGWGEVEEQRTDSIGRSHRQWRAKLHRPPLRAKALGAHGLLVEFGRAGNGGHAPDGSRAGKWERNQRGQWLPFLGRIVDLIGPAFALDGLDTS